jgi:hypothetical protein
MGLINNIRVCGGFWLFNINKDILNKKVLHISIQEKLQISVWDYLGSLLFYEIFLA